MSECCKKVAVKVYLVLICGPPGIGKTVLTNNLYKQATEAARIRSFRIHYDDLIDSQLETTLIEANEWKQEREKIKRLVHQLVNRLSNESEMSSQCHESVDLVEENFQKILKPDLVSLHDHSTFLILLDDIFYYESMRYRFYRMCFSSDIQCECSFFSVCLRTSKLDTLMVRNRARPVESRVLEKSVENIFGKFEYPKDWEIKHSLLIDIDQTCLDSASILNEIVSNHDVFIEIVNKFRLSLEKSVVQDTNRNLSHESDLILRRLVSEKLKSTGEERGELGKRLSSRKASLLAEIKNSNSDLFKLLSALDDLSSIEIELRCRLFE